MHASRIIPVCWARVQLSITFILTAEMAAFVRLALLQDGPMPTKRVPTAFFGHFMRQPSPSGRSCSKPLLHSVLYCPRFSRSRLWNRSVFMVFVQVGIPVSGVGSASESATREIPSLFWSSRLQMVTLSQPATDSQLLALWPTLASTEALLLTVELPPAYRPVRSPH